MKTIKYYVELYKIISELSYVLCCYSENLDILLLINRLDTVEKIDEILVNLENLTEITNELLESDNFPFKHILNKLEDDNMLLQGLLLSSQAHKTDSTNPNTLLTLFDVVEFDKLLTP